MYRKIDKSRVWKLTGAFFGAMVLFTLLSRAVYQHGTAVVVAEAPSSGVITHSIRATGKVYQNQDLAVTTVGGLRVASVWVNEGQQVRAGDVLFSLDMDYLTETIAGRKREMEKQKLSIQDAWSQTYATAQQRSNQQAQAEENYAAAVSQAETTLERTERALERAERALENFYNGVTEDKAQEAALVRECQEAQESHRSAQAALEQLQGEIERRVQETVEQTKQEGAQPAPAETPPTTEATQPPTEATQPPTEATQPPTEATQPPTEAAQPPTEAAQPPETTQPPETAQPLPAQTPAPTEPEVLPAGGSGVGMPRLVLLSAAATPVDLDAVAAAVRESYAQQLAAAQGEVERTAAALADAQAELEAYRAQQSGGAEPSEQALLDSVEKARENYDDALAALENAKTTYGRAIQSAGLPDGTNHAAQIGQINYDQMAQELGKLEALLEEEGEIRAPVDGLVTSCRVQTGEKTTDTTSVLLADLSRGCKFSCTVTEEQSQYIGVGDLVTLQGASGGKRYQDLPVTLLAPGEEETYQMTVQLPENTLALGASAELTYTRRSQPYNCCVPLSALHLDERNQPYVLVAETVKSVLGTQTQARKVPVTVLERSDTSAALAEGSLNREEQVIVSADRAIDAGSRVRVD